MKTFAGNKTRAQVKAQCKAAGVQFDERAYKAGSDFTFLRGGGACVAWSSWNGRFFGKTPDGIEFNSDSDEWDGEPWMQALLNFFYVEKTA
jgi:hypothetical protein